MMLIAHLSLGHKGGGNYWGYITISQVYFEQKTSQSINPEVKLELKHCQLCVAFKKKIKKGHAVLTVTAENAKSHLD